MVCKLKVALFLQSKKKNEYLGGLAEYFIVGTTFNGRVNKMITVWSTDGIRNMLICSLRSGVIPKYGPSRSLLRDVRQ